MTHLEPEAKLLVLEKVLVSGHRFRFPGDRGCDDPGIVRIPKLRPDLDWR